MNLRFTRVLNIELLIQHARRCLTLVATLTKNNGVTRLNCQAGLRVLGPLNLINKGLKCTLSAYIILCVTVYLHHVHRHFIILLKIFI